MTAAPVLFSDPSVNRTATVRQTDHVGLFDVHVSEATVADAADDVANGRWDHWT